MSGIFLILVAILWVVFAAFLVKLVAAVLPKVWWAYLLRAVLFLALVPLPLIDEIIGEGQFKQLCREYAVLKVREKAAGKTVYLSIQPDFEVEGTWIRVVVKPWKFVEVNTGETVVSYHTLVAARRFIRFSEGGSPITFRGTCEPGGVVDPIKLFKELGITQIQRSEIKPKGTK